MHVWLIVTGNRGSLNTMSERVTIRCRRREVTQCRIDTLSAYG